MRLSRRRSLADADSVAVQYQKGGFTDEQGVYHHSGHNLTFGYMEILNEWDANAHLASPDWVSASGIQANIRRYIGIYDGATRVIRRHHPRIKFLGACSGGVHPDHDSIYWRTFLNRSEHAPGTPVSSCAALSESLAFNSN